MTQLLWSAAAEEMPSLEVRGAAAAPQEQGAGRCCGDGKALMRGCVGRGRVRAQGGARADGTPYTSGACNSQCRKATAAARPPLRSDGTKGYEWEGRGLRVLGGAAHLRLEPVPWLSGRHQAEGGEAGQVVLEGWRAAGKGKPLGGRISSNTWIIHSAPKPTTPPHVAAAVISLLPGKNLCGNTWASGQQAGYSTVRVGTVG